MKGRKENVDIQQKTDLIVNAICGKRADRVLIGPDIDQSYICQMAGIDLFRATWDYNELVRAFRIMLEEFPIDFNMGFDWLSPERSEILGSRNWRQNSEGVMQHPEVTVMEIEDYEAFIEDPMACITSTILPRLHTNLAGGGMQAATTLARAMMFEQTKKYDYFTKLYEVSYEKAVPLYYGSMFYAPFDMLADLLRGISQIAIDVRKRGALVEQACEKLAVLMVDYIKTSFPVPESGFPLTCSWVHLPPMINPRQFDRFFWPTFKYVCDELAGAGYNLYLHFQGDYMDGKYFDYYSTLPANHCMIAVEQQDFRHALETIGKDHFISCAYPIRTFASHTKEECVQKAKELLDIGMSAGGNFYFGFDKPPFLLSDGAPDKIKAVFDYVAEHGVYGG